MDGNGRWGIKKKKSRHYGHKKGLETVEKIISVAIEKKNSPIMAHHRQDVPPDPAKKTPEGLTFGERACFFTHAHACVRTPPRVLLPGMERPPLASLQVLVHDTPGEQPARRQRVRHGSASRRALSGSHLHMVMHDAQTFPSDTTS